MASPESSSEESKQVADLAEETREEEKEAEEEEEPPSSIDHHLVDALDHPQYGSMLLGMEPVIQQFMQDRNLRAVEFPQFGSSDHLLMLGSKLAFHYGLQPYVATGVRLIAKKTPESGLPLVTLSSIAIKRRSSGTSSSNVSELETTKPEDLEEGKEEEPVNLSAPVMSEAARSTATLEEGKEEKASCSFSAHDMAEEKERAETLDKTNEEDKLSNSFNNLSMQGMAESEKMTRTLEERENNEKSPASVDPNLADVIQQPQVRDTLVSNPLAPEVSSSIPPAAISSTVVSSSSSAEVPSSSSIPPAAISSTVVSSSSSAEVPGSSSIPPVAISSTGVSSSSSAEVPGSSSIPPVAISSTVVSSSTSAEVPGSSSIPPAAISSTVVSSSTSAEVPGSSSIPPAAISSTSAEDPGSIATVYSGVVPEGGRHAVLQNPGSTTSMNQSGRGGFHGGPMTGRQPQWMPYRGLDFTGLPYGDYIVYNPYHASRAVYYPVYSERPPGQSTQTYYAPGPPFTQWPQLQYTTHPYYSSGYNPVYSSSTQCPPLQHMQTYNASRALNPGYSRYTQWPSVLHPQPVLIQEPMQYGAGTSQPPQPSGPLQPSQFQRPSRPPLDHPREASSSSMRGRVRPIDYEDMERLLQEADRHYPDLFNEHSRNLAKSRGKDKIAGYTESFLMRKE